MSSSFTPINVNRAQTILRSSAITAKICSDRSICSEEATLKRRRTFVAESLGERGDAQSTPSLKRFQLSGLTASGQETVARTVERRRQYAPREANETPCMSQQSVQSTFRITKASSPPERKQSNSECRAIPKLEQDETFHTIENRSYTATTSADSTDDKVAIVSPMTSQNALKAQQTYSFTAYDTRASQEETRLLSAQAFQVLSNVQTAQTPASASTQSTLPPLPSRRWSPPNIPVSEINQLFEDREPIVSPVLASSSILTQPDAYSDYGDLSDDDLAELTLPTCQASSLEAVPSEGNFLNSVAMPLGVYDDGDDGLIDDWIADSDSFENVAIAADTQPEQTLIESPTSDGSADSDSQFDDVDDELFLGIDMQEIAATGRDGCHTDHPITIDCSQPNIPGLKKLSMAATTLPPIVRPPFPSPVRDRSPIIGLSNDHLLRTCFRIGEAINEGRLAMRTNRSVHVELYAKVVSTTEVSDTKQTFALGDMFHDRPPFLDAVYAVAKGMELWNYDRGRLHEKSSTPKVVCRCVGKLQLRDRKLELLLNSIWEASWEDVAHVKGILCS